MRKLLLLFIKNGGVFLFLFLEVFSLYLVAQFNQPQGAIAATTFNNATQKWHNGVNWVENKFALGAYADSLSRANRLLMEERNVMSLARRSQVDSITTEWKQQYVLIQSRVINNSVSLTNNHLVLDKGKGQGLRPNMGVISETGLVGIVKDVSHDFALVMSLLNSQTRISAQIKRTNDFGSLTWNGLDETHMQLNDIPRHVTPEVGDTIQTSGYSQLFPRGLMIGVIDKYDRKAGSNFYDIDVKLSNRLRQLHYAYVVDNLMATQLDSLLEQTNGHE